MTRNSPRTAIPIGLAVLMLTVGLAGCFTTEDPAETTPASDCPRGEPRVSRGSGSPTVVTQQYLTQNERWEPDYSKRADYKVESQPLHLNAHRLTIARCTIIEMGEDAGIEAERPGSLLMIEGEPGQEVVIRGANQSAGHWDSISLHLSQQDDHVFKHAVIEHGGGPALLPNGGITRNPAVDVKEISPSRSLTIHNTSVQNTSYQGLWMEPDANAGNVGPGLGLVFENNTFTSNEGVGVATTATLAEVLDPGSVYRGNGGPGIWIMPRTLEGTHRWEDLGEPYHVWDGPHPAGEPIKVDGLLYVQEGATVEFEEGRFAGIVVEGDNPRLQTPGLRALGTSERSVTFTGATKSPGSWGGIRIKAEGSRNVLRHTDISLGGGLPFGQGEGGAGANLALLSGDQQPYPGYRVTLQDVLLTFSEDDGLRVGEPASIDLELGDTSFGANDRHPIAVHPDNIEDLAPYYSTTKVTFMGNPDPGIAILDNQLPPGQLTFPVLETYYNALEGLTKPLGELTLPAGTHIKFPKDESLRIDRSTDNGGFATLKAQGTASNPVVLEGTRDTAGFWGGLYFQTGASDNVLEHTRIRNGGAIDWASETCGNAGYYNPSVKQAGNLVIGYDCTGAPDGKVAWKSGSSTKHPPGVAGIWANTCKEITLATQGSPQVSYAGFDTGDPNARLANCPPQSN